MPLLARINRTHSVGEFRRAARLRFAEAQRAIAADDRLIGVYLAGYAAEMTLKGAYFRVIGKGPGDPITVGEVQAAKVHAKVTLGIAWPGNLHDLTRWTELLVEERVRRQQPLATAIAGRLVREVVRVAINWREDLRYHENRPRVAEVAETFQAVQWLLDNGLRLTW